MYVRMEKVVVIVCCHHITMPLHGQVLICSVATVWLRVPVHHQDLLSSLATVWSSKV